MKNLATRMAGRVGGAGAAADDPARKGGLLDVCGVPGLFSSVPDLVGRQERTEPWARRADCNGLCSAGAHRQSGV